ncbi:MAG: transcription elongation protein SprT [Rhodospirillales bacterium]|nr:transcription elongation protein SprT [Rhodospirillales bacterium]
MTATTAGEAFKQSIAPILAAIGALPHAALGFGASSAPPKQKARLLKAECGYTVHVTRKWVDEAGAPHRPHHGAMQVDCAEGPEDGAEGIARAA